MRLRQIVLLLLLALVIGAFVALDLGRYLSFEQLKASQARFDQLYAQQPLTVAAVYFGVYVLATALSFPGAVIITLAGGAVFGLWQGLLLVSFASTLGATLAFLASRYVLREWVEARFGQRLADINAGVEKEGALYLFTLRLIPVVPFFLINLLMGLTRMKTWTYYWVSQLGMLAGTVVYVNAGTQLAQLDSVRGILSPALLGSFVLLGIFPLIARRIVAAVQKRKVYARWAEQRPASFDRNLIVIGGGAGGLVSAYIAAAVKAKVTLIEAHKMGGDCLNYGCVPSKALNKSAKIAHQIRHASNYGLSNAAPSFSFKAVMQRVHDVIKAIEPHDSIARYTGLGVEVLQGYGKLVNPWTVEVTLNDGTAEPDSTPKVVRLTARSIVIAAGARPVVPDLPGLDDVGYLTSDTLWDEFAKLDNITQRIVVLGGGPAGCELSQSFARLGAQVTQVEMGDRIMVREDEEVSALARDALQADGVQVLTGHKALRCERMSVDATPPVTSSVTAPATTPVTLPVTARSEATRQSSASTSTASVNPPVTETTSLKPQPEPRHEGTQQPLDDHPSHATTHAEKYLIVEHKGQEKAIPFDALICVVGRVASLQGYGLEEIGVPTHRTIDTNEYLQTLYPNIYAAGDVAGPYQFTHVAAHQAWYATVNALFGDFKSFKVDYRVIPSATFIDPEVARVGLNEQEAQAQGIAYEVTKYGIDDLDRAIADSEAHGFVKVLTVPGKDRILGVTIVGSHAADLLAEYVLAMKHGLGLNKILGTIHTYPTMAEANKYAAGEWKRAHAPQKLLAWVQKFHNWRRN